MKIAAFNINELNAQVKIIKILNHLMNKRCTFSFLTKIHQDNYLKYECNRKFAITTIVILNADWNNNTNMNFLLLNLWNKSDEMNITVMLKNIKFWVLKIEITIDAEHKLRILKLYIFNEEDKQVRFFKNTRNLLNQNEVNSMYDIILNDFKMIEQIMNRNLSRRESNKVQLTL